MIRIVKGITQEHLEDVYSDTDIRKAFIYDGGTFEPIHNQLVTYYSAFYDDIFLGAFLCIKISQYDVEIHLLLNKLSAIYSRRLTKMMFDDLFEEDILRISSKFIDGNKPTMINFAKKLGAKQEGKLRNAIKSNGIIRDIVIYGITKEDWRASNGIC